MSFEEFKNSLDGDMPPPGVSEYAQSLWYDAKGKWDRAHEVVQDLADKNAAWIHAYLHRKEGDLGNADYWYRNASRKRPSATLEEEWEELARAFL